MTEKQMNAQIERSNFINEALRVFDERNGNKPVLRHNRATVGQPSDLNTILKAIAQTTDDQEFNLLVAAAQKLQNNAANTVVAAPPTTPGILLNSSQIERTDAYRADCVAWENRRVARLRAMNAGQGCVPPTPAILLAKSDGSR